MQWSPRSGAMLLMVRLGGRQFLSVNLPPSFFPSVQKKGKLCNMYRTLETSVFTQLCEECHRIWFFMHVKSHWYNAPKQYSILRPFKFVVTFYPIYLSFKSEMKLWNSYVLLRSNSIYLVLNNWESKSWVLWGFF